MVEKKQAKKRTFSLKALLVIEVIICYMAILTVISYWRGPVHYKILADKPLLETTDFVSFGGEPVQNKDVFIFANDTIGNAIGYTADLCLRNLERMSVSFTLDCPGKAAGGILHIDLFADGYDSDEQEFKLELQEGLNDVAFSLEPGAEAPESAQLRFFTLDWADYEVQNVRLYAETALPKVSKVLLVGMFACLLVLLLSVFIFFRHKKTFEC